MLYRYQTNAPLQDKKECNRMKKKICALFLTLCMTMTLFTGISFTAFATTVNAYHPGDVAAMKAIIDSNADLFATKYPHVKANDPATWGTMVTWNTDVPNKRIIRASFYNLGLSGTLDLRPLSALTDMDCMDNKLTSINVSGLTNLTTIFVSRNRLTSLELTGATGLESVYCTDNKLTSMNFPSLANLDTVFLSRNQLTSLDVS